MPGVRTSACRYADTSPMPRSSARMTTKLGRGGSAAEMPARTVTTAKSAVLGGGRQRGRDMRGTAPEDGTAAYRHRNRPPRDGWRTPGDAWSPGAAFTSPTRAHVEQQSPQDEQHVGPQSPTQHPQRQGPSQLHEPVSQHPQQPTAAHAPEVPLALAQRKGEPMRAALSAARDNAIFMEIISSVGFEKVWKERNVGRHGPTQFRHTPRRIRTGRRGASIRRSTAAVSTTRPSKSSPSHAVGTGPASMSKETA